MTRDLARERRTAYRTLGLSHTGRPRTGVRPAPRRLRPGRTKALYPQTVCTNTVRKKNIPNIAVPLHYMIRFAADRSRLRKIRNGISACGLRDSTTKPASGTTGAASETMTARGPGRAAEWCLCGRHPHEHHWVLGQFSARSRAAR